MHSLESREGFFFFNLIFYFLLLHKRAAKERELLDLVCNSWSVIERGTEESAGAAERSSQVPAAIVMLSFQGAPFRAWDSGETTAYRCIKAAALRCDQFNK